MGGGPVDTDTSRNPASPRLRRAGRQGAAIVEDDGAAVSSMIACPERAKRVEGDGRSHFRHLYLHVPFCLSRCQYCAFYSQTGWADEDLDRWLEGVLLELDQQGILPGHRLDTIYIGGGTPSLLGFDRLNRLLAELSRRFSVHPQAEITLETNPGALTPEVAAALPSLGITRLSVGVQSLHDSTLGQLGRCHSVEQARGLILAALNAGLQVSADLLYSLPGQDLARWQADLHTILSWGVHHLSCYELTVESGTPLAARVAKGSVNMPEEEARTRFFLDTHRTLDTLGFPAYEISSFAGREGWRSRHNQAYWNHASYLGVGPGAHSLLGRLRMANPADHAAWYARLSRGEAPDRFTETLDDEQVLLEAVMLGLRTSAGLHVPSIEALAKEPLAHAMRLRASELERQGWLTRRAHRWVPTLNGWLIADRLPGMLLWDTPTGAPPPRPSSSAQTSR